MEKNSKTYKMVFAALMTAVMCIISPITIPVMGGVGANLSVFVVLMMVYLLGFPMGVVSCVMYLLLGLVGLPVFSGYQGGVGVFMGPTGGFLIGYIFLGTISGAFLKIKNNSRLMFFCGSLIGLLVCYLFGTLWYMFVTGVNLVSAITVCVLPYVLFDLVKIVTVCAIAPLFKKKLMCYH